MSKIRFNENLLVLVSVVVLLLFMGLILLLGSFIKMFLGEAPEEVVCPEIQITEEERANLEQQATWLLKLHQGEALAEEEAALINSSCLDDDNIALALGFTYYQLGDYQPAKDFLSLALIERDDSFVYDLMAQNELRHCHYQQAREYLLTALDRRPSEYSYWEKLINLEKKHFQADDQRLAELYQQGIEASDDWRAFTLYAHFLEGQEKYQEAADVWTGALVAHPQYQEHYGSRVDWLRAK